jgi:hypothetical protein
LLLKRVNIKSQQKTTLSTLEWIHCEQFKQSAIGLQNQKGENEMNKKQNPNALKVRKAGGGPIGMNHNESALKVRKGGPVTGNHNETALRYK